MSTTRVDEIANGLFRIHTPYPSIPGGFSFNQYLLRDQQSLLFHTGPRAMFPAIRDAVASVLPLSELHYVGFCHVESDECGSLNPFLAAAPNARPLCSQLAALVSISDLADRSPCALADGERLSLGKNTVRWINAPHVPHGWENGFLLIEELSTLLCGDLFTQPGAEHPPLVTTDILAPSEAMLTQMDYYAHGPNTTSVIRQLAALRPHVLACMHGSAWQGDGETLLGRLADSLMPRA
jgi:flavorubredoxin